MHSSSLLLLASSLAALTAAQQETVWAVYMFHRHGDRTPKILPPARLTALGYQEVLTSGEYYRGRYVDSNAALKIQGIAPNIASAGQLSVTSPSDTVLQDSAAGFLQGLYPPVAGQSETLRNGTIIQAPMNGYQLIPIGITTAGAGSEDSGWLQSSTGCNNAVISSNNFFLSAEYNELYNSTLPFYQRLEPVINATFPPSADNFKNAYTIFDLINVAEIHNATINSSDLLDNSTLLQLRTLADAHEFGLAYNASDDARAIAGMQLAGQIVQFFNASISSKGSGQPRLGVQFGAYATFQSFFGLANLTSVSPDFYGIPDYSSAMVFELFTDGSAASPSTYPSASDLQVRFLFHNGTTSNISEPTAFPLFGASSVTIPWSDFQNKMESFAVQTTQQWCHVCGNTTGTCAPYANGASSSSASGSSSGSSSHMSAAIGGVIGAFVTLGVILGLEALAMLLGGLRLVSKRRLAGTASPTNVGVATKA